MDKLSRKFGQLQQWTAEKAFKAQKSEADDEFKQLKAVADAKKEVFERLANDGKQLLIFSGKTQKNAFFNVGTSFGTAGSTLPEDSVWGEALIKYGDAIGRIGALEAELETSVAEKFIAPTNARVEGDLKEYAHQLKKLEGRRLDYDGKAAKVAKNKKEDKAEVEAELQTARTRYEETMQVCRDAMQSIIYGNEDDDVAHLASLVEAQRKYFAASLAIMEELSRTLTDPSVKGNRIVTAVSAGGNALALPPRNLTIDEDIPPQSPSEPVATSPVPAIKPKPKPPVPATQALGPDQVTAAYNFVPESEDELGFRKGDTITVLKRDPEGWWTGELNGRTGIFPMNYVSS